MSDFLSGAFLWIKALHVISVMAWMAGMLYLPRLFVYHTETEPGSAESERFKLMERRLLRAIINPAMVAAYVFGGLMLVTDGVADWNSAWLYVKFVGVAVLTHMHHLMVRWWKAFERDENAHSQRYFRIANEVPTLAMIVIVIMVIVRPF